jgi:hypothetical protein
MNPEEVLGWSSSVCDSKQKSYKGMQTAYMVWQDRLRFCRREYGGQETMQFRGC